MSESCVRKVREANWRVEVGRVGLFTGAPKYLKKLIGDHILK
jgi:hypothetical protein